jgi:hypothetical protein
VCWIDWPVRRQSRQIAPKCRTGATLHWLRPSLFTGPRGYSQFSRCIISAIGSKVKSKSNIIKMICRRGQVEDKKKCASIYPTVPLTTPAVKYSLKYSWKCSRRRKKFGFTGYFESAGYSIRATATAKRFKLGAL